MQIDNSMVLKIMASIMVGPAGQWLAARLKDVLGKMHVTLNPWLMRTAVLLVVYPLILAMNAIMKTGLTYSDAEVLVETIVAALAAMTAYHTDTPNSVPSGFTVNK